MIKIDKLIKEASWVNGKERKDSDLVWKQTSLSPEEAIKKYGKDKVKVTKGGLVNGNDMVEILLPLKENWVNQAKQKHAAKGDPKSKPAYIKKFRDLGFVVHPYGFTDYSKSIMTPKEFYEFAKKEGYRLSKTFTAFGKKQHVFEQPGGPYTDDILTMDEDGGYVRHVTQQFKTDKT